MLITFCPITHIGSNKIYHFHATCNALFNSIRHIYSSVRECWHHGTLRFVPPEKANCLHAFFLCGKRSCVDSKIPWTVNVENLTNWLTCLQFVIIWDVYICCSYSYITSAEAISQMKETFLGNVLQSDSLPCFHNCTLYTDKQEDRKSP